LQAIGESLIFVHAPAETAGIADYSDAQPRFLTMKILASKSLAIDMICFPLEKCRGHRPVRTQPPEQVMVLEENIGIIRRAVDDKIMPLGMGVDAGDIQRGFTDEYKHRHRRQRPDKVFFQGIFHGWIFPD